MGTPNKIALTIRDISGKRSFMTFEEGGEKTIAAVFSKQDLQDLLYVLKDNPPHWAPDFRNRIGNLHEGIKQLLNEIP